MSKLLTLKEIVEMNSDEFYDQFLLLENEDRSTQQRAESGDIDAEELIFLYLSGKITGGGFKLAARILGSKAVISAAKGMGPWVALLIAGAVGYGLGVYLRQYVYPDYSGEAIERIKRAISDPQYAINELEVYCRGTGPLCTRQGGDVRCAKEQTFIGRNKTTGKRVKYTKTPKKQMGGYAVGGYAYETATGANVGQARIKVSEADLEKEKGIKKLQDKLGTTWGSFIGALGDTALMPIGYALKKTGFEDEFYVQTPGEFDTKDIAVIAGIAHALY
jgi:hypothetical protein